MTLWHDNINQLLEAGNGPRLIHQRLTAVHIHHTTTTTTTATTITLLLHRPVAGGKQSSKADSSTSNSSSYPSYTCPSGLTSPSSLTWSWWSVVVDAKASFAGETSTSSKGSSSSSAMSPVCTARHSEGYGCVQLFMATHLRATERHAPYRITQCYLPPGTDKCALP